jgi:uncharacterized protein YyaL (SSP411 family)
MSRLLRTVLVSVAMANSLFGEGVAWRTWDAGMKEAKASHKIIMIDAVRTGCHYCDDMEEAVFRDAVMAAYIESRFVPVKVNLSNEKMPLDLDVSMTPTFFFVTEEGTLLKRVPGSWNRKDFRSFLEGVKR